MSENTIDFNNLNFKNVFDIGANIGNYTKMMIEKGAEQVIAVEASLPVASILILTFQDKPQVKIVPKAASFNETQIYFFQSTANTISTANPEWISNSRFTGEHQWCQPEKVDATTIDKLIEDYGMPDHIKIDVEGYEFQVLAGLTKKIPALISFEWAEETKENLARSLYYLKQLGYDKFGYTLNTDALSAFNGEFKNFSQFVKPFLDTLVPDRKTEWGMIYVMP